MARISQEQIQTILDKTDIVDLVSEQVALSKKGKSYFGLCPFHDEKTPSFAVEPTRKIFNCFSCGEKGNAITFLQKTKNLNFVESVKQLANRANIELDVSSMQKEHKHQKYFDINSDAKEFYSFYLQQTKQGQIAKSYLHNRGITDDIMKEFQLGLAPKEYDLLYQTLNDKDYLVSDMYDLGLVKQSKKETFYDLFRRRIIFPIHDHQGHTVAFSGRVYEEEDDSAKYINSPQTIVFTKSNTLYNLHHALPHIKQNNRVVLFEGYMDVIAAYRANILESVASMGTSLTLDQVRILKRYTNQVVICYDGDAAGMEATSRAIRLLRKEGIKTQIVMLPDNLDPDDYIEKYSEEDLTTFINEQWIDDIEFSYRQSNSDIDFNKMLDIERFKKTIFDLIKNTSNTIIESYLKRLSDDINISVESIRQDFIQYTKRNIRNITRKQYQQIPIESKYVIAERKLINYFIQDFKYLLNFNNEFGEVFYVDSEVYNMKLLIEDLHLETLEDETKEFSLEKLYEQFTPAQIHFFETRIQYKKLELIDEEYHDLIQVLNQYIKSILIANIENKIKDTPNIQEKIKLAQYRDVSIKEENNGS